MLSLRNVMTKYATMTQEEFIKRYTYDPVNDLLGEGGFGRVYRAYDNYEHEYVAVKLQGVDPKFPEIRLRNEVQKVQQYVHKNIARYKEWYTFSDYRGETDVAIMKFYNDGSLDKLIAKHNLPIEVRHGLLVEILEGIAFLHSEGIIHRDLKPQNILVVEHGGHYTPLITDFGISKQLAENESSAVSNSFLGGTRSYASPEQMAERSIRKNTDLWSFGIIAYQMFTGTPPFNCGAFSPSSEEGRQEHFRQITSGILPKSIESIPEPWQGVIRSCLQVDNTRRVQHAEECLAMVGLKAFTPGIAKGSVETVREEPKPQSKPQPRPQPKPSGNNETKKQGNIRVILFALLLIVGFGIGLYVSLSGDDSKAPSTPPPAASEEPKAEVVEVAAKSEPTSYSVGDYYNKDGIKGIVIETDGRSGIVVSMVETSTRWCSEQIWNSMGFSAVGTNSKSNGMENSDKMRNHSDLDGYYAFEWAIARGDGWYLPAIFELENISANFNVINEALVSNGGTKLSKSWYASSTESNVNSIYIYDFYQMKNYTVGKDLNCYVRAFHKF